MSDVIDAKSVQLCGTRVLFDTNIWILIFDYNAASLRHKTEVYSSAYRSLLENGNSIIVNDYILGELCNRCTRIQYDVDKANSEDHPDKFPSHKAYRKTEQFRSAMECVRDTCLNIVDDHEFVSTSGTHYDVHKVLERFCDGELDFTDIVLTDFCKKENLYLMTDDREFFGAGIKLITANKRLFEKP
jgi:predicted nucleic acid-binding protein